MTNLKNQLLEDKALRDAAREVVKMNVEHVKSLASPDTVRNRAILPTRDKALQLKANATETALDNKGKIAAVLGVTASAAILWFVREPLLSLIEQFNSDTAPENTYDEMPDGKAQ